MASPPEARPPGWFATIAPGVLIAATGVGAGDLLTASLAGSAAGVTILWTAWIGAVLKGSLNEGIARWQMATDSTLLKGWVDHLGAWIRWVFMAYLLLWSVCAGGALISACGLAGAVLWPLFGSTPDQLHTARIAWGIAHTVAGLACVRYGGFRLFERVMGACIAVMFVTVLCAATMLRPDWQAVAGGLMSFDTAGQLTWCVGVIGGVGGTVTILSYGYWIREHGRAGATGLRACRIDLTIGYGMTALFGTAMIVIGAGVDIRGSGSGAAAQLADQLGAVLGPVGRAVFLWGFWAAVFSSLLGVWQGVPYLFADFVALSGWRRAATTHTPLTHRPEYRGFGLFMALAPLPLLWITLRQVQLLYAVGGALFMPLLAITLLILNNSRTHVGHQRNGWLANSLLIATLLLFAEVGRRTWMENL